MSGIAILLIIVLVLFGAIYVLYNLLKKKLAVIQELEKRLQEKASKAFRLGQSKILGDYSQILATLDLLDQYDDIILLSTTSSQGPLDLMGIKEDQLDFIEIKNKGAQLTQKERKLQQIIEQKNVNYKIMDVELPEEVVISEREEEK